MLICMTVVKVSLALQCPANINPSFHLTLVSFLFGQIKLVFRSRVTFVYEAGLAIFMVTLNFSLLHTAGSVEE